MKKFVLKQWITTLIISPLLILLITFFDGQSMNFEGSYELYLLMFLFSILFSIPTYVFMFVVAYFLNKEERSMAQKKLILFSISLLGIIISFEIFLPDSTYYFILSYILISLASTFVFKINHQNLSK